MAAASDACFIEEDPNVMDAGLDYQVLLNENANIKANNAFGELSNEILKLRSLLNAGCDDDNIMPRKLPRTEASSSVSDSMPSINTNNNNNSYTPLVSNNGNAKNNNNSSIDTNTSTNSQLNNSNKNNSNKDSSVAYKNKNTQNKKKILQAVNVDLKSLNSKLKNAQCSSYTIKQSNRSGPVKIAITSEQEIPRIKNELLNSGVSFHEYKWDAEKAKAFIIRGLVDAAEDDLPHIKNELIEAGLPDTIVVSLYRSGFMKSNPSDVRSSLVQVILPPNTDATVLFNIKYLDHVAIKIEPRKNNKTLQCKNCQRFGHSAGGCQHPHRCVKCGEDHYRQDCPRSFNKSVKLLCCNCGGEHTANNINSCQYAINSSTTATKANLLLPKLVT